MTHLEQLIYEYYDWQDYLVKRNVKVGRLKHGGWEMELDIIAYNPKTKHLIHIEPSIDAHSWEKRQLRFLKKIEAGKKYILNDIFNWLDGNTTIEQCAILVSHPKGRDKIGDGVIKSVDELAKEISDKITEKGIMSRNAIPEQYQLLRTIQLVKSGYYRQK
jgi:hypothetical protein